MRWPGPRWIVATVAGAAAIVGALAIGRAGGRAAIAPGAAGASGSAVPSELAALRGALEQEVLEREMLAAEVELMRSVIEQIASERMDPLNPSGPLAEPLPGEEPAAGPGRAPRGPLDLDEALLQQIGLVESEVRDLRDRWDEAQLDRLELNDRAAREGWLFRPRHRRQIDRLDAELRQELGETDYDRMLFATDQANRVVVRSVIGGSPAAAAGVLSGDYVLSYGSERVFTPKDVRNATTAGVKGERVRMIVERGGERISLLVPRGPLGVRMTAEKGTPSP